jgi:hypothetical protein
MFAHIFNKSFIYTDSIPTIINNNYEISHALTHLGKVVDNAFDILLEHEESDEDTDIFFRLEQKDFNMILNQFIELIGLDYEVYRYFIKHSKLYDLLCSRPYNIPFIECFDELPESEWYHFENTTESRFLKRLPLEFWINHITEDTNIRNRYMKLLEEYNSSESFINKYLNPEDEGKRNIHIGNAELFNFINNKDNNMCYNDEFSYLFFMKPLMFHLKKIGYKVGGGLL